MTENLPIVAATVVGAETWPDLPEGFKNGVFHQIGSQAYVGLGSLGRGFYKLDLLKQPANWKQLSSFPGPQRDFSAAAAAGEKLHVFSGVGLVSTNDSLPQVLEDGYCYEPTTDLWRRLDTKTPVGLLGASAFALDEDRIVFLGGCNKEVYDGFIRERTAAEHQSPDAVSRLTRHYLGQAPHQYRWNSRVLVYTISTNSWSDLGDNPFPPNAGSALAAKDQELTIVHGEIKPGLRSVEVTQLRFENKRLVWSKTPPFPPRPGETIQEGLAGAFAGYSEDVLLVAGGTNFAGSQTRAAAGFWYAHEGLTKRWCRDVYAFRSGEWIHAGELPLGLAYGASFSVRGGLLILGGEDERGLARCETYLLSWAQEKLRVSRQHTVETQ